jgi:hypothetical protein
MDKERQSRLIYNCHEGNEKVLLHGTRYMARLELKCYSLCCRIFIVIVFQIRIYDKNYGTEGVTSFLRQPSRNLIVSIKRVNRKRTHWFMDERTKLSLDKS